MAQSKINQNQLKFSTVPGSFIASDASNIFTIVAPTTGADRIPFYDDSATAAGYLTLGTNLSITGTTLNATAGAGGITTVQEEGSGLTARSTINFIGSGITAADDAGNSRTNVTIAAFLNTLATAGVVGLAGSDVSGTLPVGKGGTGATTLTGLLQGNGTSAVTAVTNPTQVGQVLRATGTTTYAWGALDLADTDAVTGVLDEVNGGTGQSTITTGDLLQGTASNTLGKLPSVATGNALISGGVTTASSWGKIGLTTHVSGILPIANGGTGSGTQNFVDLTNVQSIGGAKTFTSNITISATPSANTDAATVGWVLNNVAGFKSGSVRVATTGILTATAQTSSTITLGGTTLSIDGQTMANGETVLVKDSVTGGSGGTFNNGAYTVSGIGSSVLLTRVAWMDTAAEIDGVYVFIQDGSTNAGTLWATISDVTTLGTDPISFTQMQTSGTIGGSAAANKVAYGSGTNTLTSTTNFHFNGTQLAVGTPTPVTSSVFTTQGTGTNNTTFGYQHNNSSGSRVFRIADNGTTIIGGIGTAVTITDGGGVSSDGVLFLDSASTSSIRATGNSSASGTGFGFSIESSTKTYTGGDFIQAKIINGFAPTSGTGTYEGLVVSHTINQTGGANGITRGIQIVPTLTAAADYRALEITANSSHYALFTTAGKIRFDFGTPAVGDILTRNTGGEEVRIAAGTSGYVLTSNGAGTKPTWQAAAGGVTITRAYLTGSTSSVIDLDSGTAVTDVDGANIAFTVPADLDTVFVVRNGIVLSRSGSTSRDYTLVSGTGVLTLAYALTADENLMVYKIA